MPDSTIIVGARVFDGTGSPAVLADVVVTGKRITRVARSIPAGERGDAGVIDAAGATLMPGMIEGHTHLGFGSSVEHVATRRELAEEKTLLIAACGRVLLDSGFTSAYSGGNRMPQAEIAARKAFAEGWLPGPRLRAASWEGSAGGGPGQAGGAFSFPGTETRPSDPASVAKFVTDMAHLGVDIVKLNLTGESALVAGTSQILQFTPEEVAAAGDAARAHGVWLTAHAHSTDGIKLALRNGIRAIYHCSYADDEAIDLLEAARDDVFVAPTPGIIYAHLTDPAAPPDDPEEMRQTAASIKQVAPELKRRGVRLVPGGDYGFPFNPIGRNARDLRLFVDWFGFTPAEALRSATQYGGQLMGMADDLGLIREGYLADLLLIEGDPLQDISLLEEPAKISMIMKDGRLHKMPAERVSRRPAPAAS